MSGWVQRWRRVVDAPRLARRVAQGRQLYRSGRVSGVRASAGLLSGRAQGNRVTPYLVEVAVEELDGDGWARVVSVLAAQVSHSARLLAGLVPECLDAELDAAGVALFPKLDELDVTCACGDTAAVCAHAAGVWEAAAATLESDPFLLLRLRGRGRDRLLADLAGARGDPGQQRAQAGVPVAELDVEGWACPRAPLDGLSLPEMGLPSTSAAPLKQLGDPPQWAGGVSAWDLFRPLVERAADYIRQLDA
ncbi:MAG: hypothetical protein ACRD0K_02140 [Egibacteraceae bacterium]